MGASELLKKKDTGHHRPGKPIRESFENCREDSEKRVRFYKTNPTLKKNLSNRDRYETIPLIDRSIPGFIITQVKRIQYGYFSTGAVSVFFAGFAIVFCFSLLADEMDISCRKNTD